MDYSKLYRENSSFKIYVDKCAKADGMTTEEELEKQTIRDVGDYYAENSKSIVVTETINVGCGGC